MRHILAAIVALSTTGCESLVTPAPVTGLTGTVVRGPIAPVCSSGDPCNAPFSAGFSVNRDGAAIAHFQSGADGHFTIMLAPATYQVVPDSDAPLLAPATQARTVTVQATGMTSVTLQFDTGIR